MKVDNIASDLDCLAHLERDLMDIKLSNAVDLANHSDTKIG